MVGTKDFLYFPKTFAKSGCIGARELLSCNCRIYGISWALVLDIFKIALLFLHRWHIRYVGFCWIWPWGGKQLWVCCRSCSHTICIFRTDKVMYQGNQESFGMTNVPSSLSFHAQASLQQQWLGWYIHFNLISLVCHSSKY